MPEDFEIAAEGECLGLRGVYTFYFVGWNVCRSVMLLAAGGEVMANLEPIVNDEYFDQMKSGEKAEEYRLVNEFWNKGIMFREYDRLIIACGYPKRDDLSKRIDIPYAGYELKAITHPHFGPDPVKVFAIRVNICP